MILALGSAFGWKHMHESFLKKTVDCFSGAMCRGASRRWLLSLSCKSAGGPIATQICARHIIR